MKILASAVCLGLLTGCSVESRMNDMRDSTKNVSKTTREMKDSTDHVAKNSDGMAEDTRAMREATEAMSKKTDEMTATTKAMRESTDSMLKKTDEVVKTTAGVEAKTDQVYSDSRQAQAMQIRTKALSDLEDTDDQVAKFSQAAHYFMAFEYQLWKGTSSDSPEKFAYLKRDAVDEFMRDVRRYIDERHPLSPAREDQKSKNLYALAATLHVINSNSLPRAQGGSLSMLDLLSDGLAAKAKVESGEVALADLPEYQKAVLTFERDVVYLLNLRLNFIPSMIITELATKESRHLNKLDLASMLLFPWRAHVEVKNLAHFNLYNELMGEVAKTQKVLRSTGLEPKQDRWLLKVLKKMRFRQRDLAKEPEIRRQAILRLEEQIIDFRNQRL